MTVFVYDRGVPPIPLTLAHSPDPDDVFMWWPLTGKIAPDGSRIPGEAGKPALDCGRFEFRALPEDIAVLNRRAVERGDLEITALSVRTWADVHRRYAVTACGASFGDGFGPKVVRRQGDSRFDSIVKVANSEALVAIPGKGTTAFMMMNLVLGATPSASRLRFVEMPFEKIIGAVARGEADLGLVIHEGQLTFGDAGLVLCFDVGEWWKRETGGLLPLGVNAVRRDLDTVHGPGTLVEVSRLLRASVKHSMDRWDESVAYTMPFAQANVDRGGGLSPTLERVNRYCRMYVSRDTLDMGESGRRGIERLLQRAAALGLAPEVASVDLL